MTASLSDYDDVAENRTQHDTSEQFDDQIANAGLLGQLRLDRVENPAL